jgi:hypothetical protein
VALAQFSADKVYTIVNRNDASLYVQDNGTGGISMGSMNENSYWQFVATGNTNCYYVKNAKTGKYAQSCADNAEVQMGDSPVEYYIELKSVEGDGMYGLASTDKKPHDFTAGTIGWNWKGNNTIQGFAAVAGTNHRSFWKIVEIEVLKTATGQNILPGEDVYLYNVESGLWLQNNDSKSGDWSTRAAIGTRGIDFVLNGSNGNFTIGGKFGSSSINPDNNYLDTGNNPAWEFHVYDDKIAAGIDYAYTINCGNKVLGTVKYNEANKQNNLFTQEGNDRWYLENPDYNINMSERITWQLWTRDERLAKAEAEASTTNPVDVSWLIPSPDFANNDTRFNKWTRNYTKIGNDGNLVRGGDENNNQTRGSMIIESWSSGSIDMYTTLTDIPNGIYRLTVQGYYRDGNRSEVITRRNEGIETIRSYYYGNDISHPFMSILDGAKSEKIDNAYDYSEGGYYYPDGMKAANRCFNLHKGYVNEEIEIIVTGKTLKLGVFKNEGVARDWTVFDNFHLVYAGPIDLAEYLANLNTAIANAEALDVSNTTTALQNALSTAISTAKATLSSEDPDELAEVTTVLNAAISNVQAVNVSFLRATVTLASAEGIDVTAANDFITNGTTANELNNVLSALRIARRIKNSEKDTHNWAGNEPAAGDFYLYNVGQQRFLCGGDDWGAHAALGYPGISVTLIADGEGFKVNTHLNNGNNVEYLGYNGYADASEQNIWKFVSVGDGKYNIARNENTAQLLGYSTGTYNRLDTDKSGSDNPDNQWILVTKANRDALMDEASAENPVDVSYLIKSPGFSQREDVSAWTLTNTSIWGRGDNHPDFAIEAYNRESASVEQTVTDLRPGTYRLKVQAFYRDGNFAKQAEILNGGGEARQLATLYAGAKSSLIQNVSVGANKAPGMGRFSSVGYMPDGIDDACLYFQTGLYWAELDNLVVGKSGSITFGARKTEKKNDGDWFVLDNFRLIYLGSYVDLTEVKADLSAKLTEANTAMTEEVAFLKTAIDNGDAAMKEMYEAEPIVEATVALTDALNEYIAGKNNLLVLKQTVEKAATEELDLSAKLNTAKAVTDGTTFAAVVEQQLYDARAERKVNLLRMPDIYTGSTPIDGATIYLYNIGTGMFLGMGSDWSTHAAVDQVGIKVYPHASDGNFYFGSDYGDFNNSPYVDTNNKAYYRFDAVDGKANVYNIVETASGDLMGWNPNGKTDGKHYWNNISNTAGASTADPNFQWKVITEAERTALIDAATAENPVDVSYLINNPSLNRKSGYDMWTKTGGARVSTTTDNNNGDRAADYGYEFYDTDNFSFTQELTNLHPGYYQVSVQGFYRDGNGDYQASVVNNGGELLRKAYLEANGEKSYLSNVATVFDMVPGLTDIKSCDNGDFPNWPNSSIEYFQHGAYVTTVNVKVGNDGTLNIGVKKDTKPNGGDWVVIDNFRLTYLGEPIETMSIVGDFTNGWDFTAEKHMTQDSENPNIWTLTVENFKAEANTYEYKLGANDRFGRYNLPNEGNNNWGFGSNEYPAGTYDLVFTANTSEHTLALNPIRKVEVDENMTYTAVIRDNAPIVLRRTFANDGAWNTFVVPFNISNAELKRAFGDDVKVAEYSENSVNPQNVIVRFKKMKDGEDAVEANVPVLLQTSTTANTFSFVADLKEATPVAEGTNFDFVGSYAASTTIPNGEFFLSGNKIYKSKGATTLMGTRAYFKAKTAGARIATLLFDNEGIPTAINEMRDARGKKAANIYDLQGRRISNTDVNSQLKKGIYIVGGKKVVK